MTDDCDDYYKNFGYSHTVQLAMDGDRDSAILMWQVVNEAVAKGKMDCDTRIWLSHVIDALLDAETKEAGVLRDRGIVRAVGLEGKRDKHRDLRRVLDVFISFENLDEEQPRSMRRKQMIAALRNWGLVSDEMEDYEVGKLIDRELAKLGGKRPET